jgi:hypothetical protein
MTTLLLGTSWINTAAKARLLTQWLQIAERLNSDCDILVVDAPSPIKPPLPDDFVPHDMQAPARRSFFAFTENIGHLTHGSGAGAGRDSKGQDGAWRAGCYGLDAAVAGEYEYVAHIECDLLCSLRIAPIIDKMRREKIEVLGTLTAGGPPKHWIETGLIFFSTDYLRRSKFTQRYNWAAPKRAAPEVIIRELVSSVLHLESWRGMRNDRNLRLENVRAMFMPLDWITHCTDPRIYDAFMENIA